jgi:hypothetical protein
MLRPTWVDPSPRINQQGSLLFVLFVVFVPFVLEAAFGIEDQITVRMPTCDEPVSGGVPRLALGR